MKQSGAKKGHLLERIEWRRHGLFVGSLSVVLVLLWFSDGGRDAARAEALTLDRLIRDAAEAQALVGPAEHQAWALSRACLEASDLWRVLGLPEAMPIRLQYGGPSVLEVSAERALVSQGLQPTEGPVIATLRLNAERAPGTALSLDSQMRTHGEPSVSYEGGALAGPWWSILPPLLAILVAIFYGDALIALVAAVLFGSALVHGANPVVFGFEALRTYVFAVFGDSFKLHILGFTLALVGMVQVAAQAGGNRGLVLLVEKLAKTARSTRLAIASMGLMVFFDDYANTLVVGSSSKPLADRMRISREKLAFLVDATAAPVAGMAIISTWVGYEVGLFDGISAELGFEMSGFEILLFVLPMRFYCILALFFVFTSAAMARDYGPMLQAERAARGRPDWPQRGPARGKKKVSKGEPPPRWFNSAIPVLVTLVSVIVGVAWHGQLSLEAEGLPAAELSTFSGWRQVFAMADNGLVLFWSSILGSAVALGMARFQGVLSLSSGLKAWLHGMRLMRSAVIILVLAWCIQAITEDLGTSYYLVSLLEPVLLPALLPLVIFIAAAVVAFATGTSWGTMGILLPSLIPLAWLLSGDFELTLLCMGAVLDGAIFGDHCSPISDTTVMSSLATGCDHMAHVRTQLPYAATVMGVALIGGYGLQAFGAPLVVSYGVGLGAILLVLRFVGKPLAGYRPSDLSEQAAG